MVTNFVKIGAVVCMAAIRFIFSSPVCWGKSPSGPLVIRKKIVAPPIKQDQRNSTKNTGGNIVQLKPKMEITVNQNLTAGQRKLMADTRIPGNVRPLYEPKGKIDPFKPLLNETPSVNADTLVYVEPINRNKTEIEKIDLSQLRLTGIVLAESGNKAVVREASGRGHIIAIGTYIGLHGGRVTRVLKDKVIIEEKMKNVMGKIFPKETELKLNKKDS